jgi:hypothetical protein
MVNRLRGAQLSACFVLIVAVLGCGSSEEDESSPSPRKLLVGTWEVELSTTTIAGVELQPDTLRYEFRDNGRLLIKQSSPFGNRLHTTKWKLIDSDRGEKTATLEIAKPLQIIKVKFHGKFEMTLIRQTDADEPKSRPLEFVRVDPTKDKKKPERKNVSTAAKTADARDLTPVNSTSRYERIHAGRSPERII